MKANLRIDEAAEELNCSTKTIRRLLADGTLLGFSLRRGGGIRIPQENIKRYIRDQTIALSESYGLEVEGPDLDK